MIEQASKGDTMGIHGLTVCGVSVLGQNHRITE